MRTPPWFCAACGKILEWIGSCCNSLYCCEGCREGQCTCSPYPQISFSEEERLRDVYRVA
jgi:hypothetical protein